MSRLAKALIYGVLAGLVLAGGWIILGLIVAHAGQDTVKSLAPGTKAPPTSAFFPESLVWKIAPWLFVAGFGSAFFGVLAPKD